MEDGPFVNFGVGTASPTPSSLRSLIKFLGANDVFAFLKLVCIGTASPTPFTSSIIIYQWSFSLNHFFFIIIQVQFYLNKCNVIDNFNLEAVFF